MARIQGLSETSLLNANAQVKTVAGYVFSITIGWAGCTVGDRLTLRDYAGSGASHVEVPFYFPTANGTITKEWVNGKEFKNGIAVVVEPQAAGSKIEYEMTYK